jgi:hypothetical protein
MATDPVGPVGEDATMIAEGVYGGLDDMKIEVLTVLYAGLR